MKGARVDLCESEQPRGQLSNTAGGRQGESIFLRINPVGSIAATGKTAHWHDPEDPRLSRPRPGYDPGVAGGPPKEPRLRVPTGSACQWAGRHPASTLRPARPLRRRLALATAQPRATGRLPGLGQRQPRRHDSEQAGRTGARWPDRHGAGQCAHRGLPLPSPHRGPPSAHGHCINLNSFHWPDTLKAEFPGIADDPVQESRRRWADRRAPKE